MKNVKTIMNKLMYILETRQKVLAVILFILSVIGAVFEMLGVSAIVPLVNVILNPEALNNISFLPKELLEDISYGELVLMVGGGIIILYLVKNVYFIFLAWYRVKFSCKVQRELSITMMQSYMNRGYQYFLNRNISELNRGVSADSAAIYAVINSGFKLLTELLAMALICIYMCFSDWQMALMLMGVAGTCLLIINIVFRKKMYHAGVDFRKYSALASQAIIQAFHGIKEVIVMHKQSHFVKEYEKNRNKMQIAQAKQVLGSEYPTYIVEAVCVTGLLAVVCVRAVTIEDTSSFVAVLASFAIGAFRILPSLGKVSSALNNITTSIPSVDSVYNNLKEANAYMEKYVLEGRNNEIRLREAGKLSFNGAIELKSVKFRYNEQADYVLNGIDLKIPKGQAIALIGQSGAGKSTLVDVILGLLRPQEGGIYMDDINIYDMPMEWAKLVGYVPQSVYLADTSIKENIAFGVERELIDENRIWAAIEKARLKEFVEQLSEGIDTFVGDRGVRLSGGQRQRIGIARALYHSPEIMILDEATSALDNDTESAVMEAIDSLQGEMTLVIIAHRLTTVKNCDVIYEVIDGKIVSKDKKEIFG